jgi:hypothetical protein
LQRLIPSAFTAALELVVLEGRTASSADGARGCTTGLPADDTHDDRGLGCSDGDDVVEALGSSRAARAVSSAAADCGSGTNAGAVILRPEAAAEADGTSAIV